MKASKELNHLRTNFANFVATPLERIWSGRVVRDFSPPRSQSHLGLPGAGDVTRHLHQVSRSVAWKRFFPSVMQPPNRVAKGTVPSFSAAAWPKSIFETAMKSMWYTKWYSPAMGSWLYLYAISGCASDWRDSHRHLLLQILF